MKLFPDNKEPDRLTEEPPEKPKRTINPLRWIWVKPGKKSIDLGIKGKF